MFFIEGKKIYDPRTAEWEVSNNPALIFGDLLMNYAKIESPDNDKVVEMISAIADFCDKNKFYLNLRIS